MKQVYDGKKVTVMLDETDPKDKVKIIHKKNKGKNPKTLSTREKADLFDLYVDVGIIQF